MTSKTEGTFGGKLTNHDNFKLAEIWVTEVGSGFEFVPADFSKQTGINAGSTVRVLNRLVEAGILTCYPHPTHRGRILYRVAWPVETKQGPVIPKQPQPVGPVSEGVLNTYSVRLLDGDKEIFEEEIKAGSPRAAADKARASLRAIVCQEWDF